MSSRLLPALRQAPGTLLNGPAGLNIWNGLFVAAAMLAALIVPAGLLLGPKTPASGMPPVLPGLLWSLISWFFEAPIVVIWVLGLLVYSITGRSDRLDHAWRVGLTGLAFVGVLLVIDTVVSAVGCSLVACFAN